MERGRSTTKKTTGIFAKRLREARLNAGMSQKALGIAAGIDEFVASARLNQYERSTHAPDYKTAQRLAKVLGVPVSYLYSDSDTEADLLLACHGLKRTALTQLIKSAADLWDEKKAKR